MTTDTQQPVTQEQIDAVMQTISSKLGGYATPADIEPVLEGMVNQNNALAPIANAVWDVAQKMHKQTGEAVAMVAMNQVLVGELTQQRDVAFKQGELKGYEEGLEIGEEFGYESASEWWNFEGRSYFAQGVKDNLIQGVSDIALETFEDTFYEGHLDDTAKKMLVDLILYVWNKAQSDMGEVEF